MDYSKQVGELILWFELIDLWDAGFAEQDIAEPLQEKGSGVHVRLLRLNSDQYPD